MLEKEAPQATEEPTEEPTEEAPDEEAPVVEASVTAGEITAPLPPRPVVEERQPLTAEQFSTALSTLTTRAKEAGLRPIQMMASTYLAQGLSMIDGLLGAFDEGNQKKKKDQ